MTKKTEHVWICKKTGALYVNSLGYIGYLLARNSTRRIEFQWPLRDKCYTLTYLGRL